MKHIKIFSALMISALMLTSCFYVNYELEEDHMTVSNSSQSDETEQFSKVSAGGESSAAATDETEAPSGTVISDKIPEFTDATDTDTVTESDIDEISVEKDGSYTSPEDVAEYIHTFGTLPDNFMTKSEAKKLGWSGGDLWKYADGMSIGGDRFGNYEGLLPGSEGRTYTECDVNYEGGPRGAERIIFSNDGLIFYTDDHYESFTQLY